MQRELVSLARVCGFGQEKQQILHLGRRPRSAGWPQHAGRQHRHAQGGEGHLLLPHADDGRDRRHRRHRPQRLPFQVWFGRNARRHQRAMLRQHPHRLEGSGLERVRAVLRERLQHAPLPSDSAHAVDGRRLPGECRRLLGRHLQLVQGKCEQLCRQLERDVSGGSQRDGHPGHGQLEAARQWKSV